MFDVLNYDFGGRSFKVNSDKLTPISPGVPYLIEIESANMDTLLYSSRTVTFDILVMPPFKARVNQSLKLYSYPFCGKMEVTFYEPGTHKISVLLKGEEIGGSPFYVTVTPVTPEPLARWYFGGDKDCKPFPSKMSYLMEAYYQMGVWRFKMCIPGDKDKDLWSFDLGKLKATKEGILSFWTSEMNICRATWFVQGDLKNQILPYTPEHCIALEKGFILDPKDKHVDVSDKARKKLRNVFRLENGEFRQYRTKDDARPEGRTVYRGFKGKNIDFTKPAPLIEQFKLVLEACWKDPRSRLNKLDKDSLKKIIDYIQQPKWDQYALLARDAKSSN